MSLNQLSVLVTMVMVMVLQEWMCEGCMENERNALLQLRDYFNYPNGSAMSSWERSPNCCYWEYVECNSITGRVTSLYLWRDSELGDWYLNVSVFLPFQELKYLSLQGINIMGCVANEGFERLQNLGKLEEVDLSDNYFNNSILPSLNGLSSLKSLYLNNNRLKGMINTAEFLNLKNLKNLKLQGNQIEGFTSTHASSGVEEPPVLSNLEFLDLSDNQLNNSMLSSLKVFSSLKSLNLGYNPLRGTLNLEVLDALRSLEELDLTGNDIIQFESLTDTNGLINLSKLILDNITTAGRSTLLRSLGAFPYLRALSLKDNDFQGSIFGPVSYSLTNLEELFLDSSSIGEKSLQSLAALPSLKRLSLCALRYTPPAQGLCNFKNLELLHLNYTTFNYNILQAVGSLTSLKTLSLCGCGLGGTIPAAQGLCNLKHLQMLDLHFNDLNGSLPWCLANLTSLRLLDISDNQFTGKIFPLKGLIWIEELRLSSNNLQIPISLGPFFNHSKLRYLDAADNEVYPATEMYNLIPKFQLETLVLSGFGYAGELPEFFMYQYNLQKVDLSNVKMEGEFPFWLLDNNTNLETLCLGNTSLSGPLRLPIHSHISLEELDISNNGFQGNIPTRIGSSLPGLQLLKISRNAFRGKIPSSFSKLRFLQVLQLDGNQFAGHVPDSLSNCSFLEMLDVSDNTLSGRIPWWIGNMSSLKVLDLSRNSFSGSLPSNFSPSQIVHVYLSENRIEGSIADAFYNCSQLITLDISRNHFTGSIPEWIDRLSMLTYLSLSYNNLEGEIPEQVCNLEDLKFIDFSRNNISGNIPPCLKCTGGSGVIDPGTRNDQQPLDFTTKRMRYSYQQGILFYFSGVDLSDNRLHGEIPPELGENMMSIKVLNLSYNSLTGPIPTTFSNLSEVESLDVSHNKLNGTIPSQLTQLHSLAVFSVAYNNLSGTTPQRIAQFGTFDESSYKGNPFLCGLPLPKSCTAAMSPPANSNPKVSTNSKEENGFLDMAVFWGSFSVSYIMVLLAIAGILWINPHWRGRWFYLAELSIIKCRSFLQMLFKFKAS